MSTETLKTGLTMLMAVALGVTLAGEALAQDEPADWSSYNRTLSGDRYAPQAAVTPATAKQLQQVCSYDLGRQSSFQTGPVVIDDTIFVTTDFDTVAIDGATCAVKWRTTETYTAAGPLKVNRGAAVADGRVFRGTQDGRVLAYDAAGGKRIWEARIADPALGETVPAALMVYVGAVDWCTTVKLASDAEIKGGKSGQPWGGANGKEPFGELDPPGQWAGWITAIDADRGNVIWKRKLPAPVLGGVTPTAGGVVFAADTLGNVYAFNALTGATVWHTQTSGAVGGGIVSYATPSGAQRVAVAAGMTSPIWPTAKVNAEIVIYGLK